MNYIFFFNQKFFFNKVFKIWLLTLLVVAFDVYFEYSTGANLLGFPEIRENSRLVSFFKDEPIVGGYIYGFCLLTIGFVDIKSKTIGFRVTSLRPIDFSSYSNIPKVIAYAA